MWVSKALGRGVIKIDNSTPDLKRNKKTGVLRANTPVKVLKTKQLIGALVLTIREGKVVSHFTYRAVEP